MITQRPHRPRTSASPGVSKEPAPNHRRRAFLAAAFAGSLAVAGVLLLPRGAADPDAKQLLDPAIAKADPQLLRQLCLLYYRHPQVPIRLACMSHMMQFSDPEVRKALWDRARNDADATVKTRALEAIVAIADTADVQPLVLLANSDATAAATITTAAMMLGNKPLLNALKK